MAHIGLPEGLPGITAAFAFRPDTAAPMRELAQALLRGPSPLSVGDRELIAAFVSDRNGCRFCTESHASVARHVLGGAVTVEAVLKDPDSAPIGDRLRTLLAIAGLVQQDGRMVTQDVISAARSAGASDIEIHDTVLIAAAFSMFNRYVDGLGAWTPTDPAAYDSMGERLAREGYVFRTDDSVPSAPQYGT